MCEGSWSKISFPSVALHFFEVTSVIITWFITSAAFRNIVRDALTQAGADMDKFNAKLDIKAQDMTIDTDVVVVGAGGAGMMSALYAAKQGLNVVLLEKSAIVGGASAMAGGSLSAVYTEDAK